MEIGIGPSVVNVYINYEKKFAFVEFRTGEHLLKWDEDVLECSTVLLTLVIPPAQQDDNPARLSTGL